MSSEAEAGYSSNSRLEQACSLRTLWVLKNSNDVEHSPPGFGLRIAHDILVRELGALTQAGGDELGIRAAQGPSLGAFDLLCYVARTCPAPLHAIESAIRYAPLVHGALSLHFVSDGDCAFLSFERPRGLIWPRALSEFMLAGLLLAVRRGSGLPCTLRRVSFAHRPPPDVGLRNFTFGCAVDYEAPVDAIAFALPELSTPVATQDSRLHGLLTAYAESELAQLFATWSFSDRVRRLLRELFPTHPPTQDEVACRLKCSVRTLHRHLRGEDTSYRKLVDEVREELALQYLVHSRLDVGKAASLLGYAQASAFRRAFRRWTASTPSEARRGATTHLTQ